MSPARMLGAILAIVAAGLIVTAALLPEFEAGAQSVTPIDPSRPGWLPILVGILVHVGLLLVAALMLVLRSPPALAGGILLGAGILGLSLRVVRLFQLAEAPALEGADGSWVDLLGETAAIAGGLVALLGSRNPAQSSADEPTAPPPPGEPPVGT